VGYESPEKLAASMSEFIVNFGKLTRQDADLLAAFALSTWFVDCFQRAPSLQFTGPSERVHLMMRLLSCICRRPILLGRLDLAALCTLPEGLNATLLIGDEKLARTVGHVLNTAGTRNLRIPFGRNWIYAYGATVLFSTPATPAQGLRVHLAPTLGILPELREETEQTIATNFHSKLLRFRMRHFDLVRDSKFDCSNFHRHMQDILRTLINPLIGCDDLKKSVLSSLLPQSEQIAGERFTDLNCLVIEAALCYCHDTSVQTFFVQEITDAVNAVFQDRHEERLVTSRLVGATLRELGLFAERVTRGYHVILTDANRRTIHRLGKEYRVASMTDGILRCDFCQSPEAGMNL